MRTRSVWLTRVKAASEEGFSLLQLEFMIISITQNAPRGGWPFAFHAQEGLGPSTSGLWGRQATNCSTAQYKQDDFFDIYVALTYWATPPLVGKIGLEPMTYGTQSIIII